VKVVSNASIPTTSKDICIKGLVKRHEFSMSEKGFQLVKDVETSFIMKDTKHVSRELLEHVVDNSSVKILETNPITKAHKEDKLGVMNRSNTALGLSITSIKIELLDH
jgi:hypothetical protein